LTIDLFERYAALDPAKAQGIQPEWSAMTAVTLPEANGREPVMQTQQQTPTQPRSPKPKRTGLLVAAAAFLLILIVGAVVLFSSASDADLPPATTPSTTAAAEPDAAATITPADALAVSESYFVAYNAGDAEGAMALVRSDARVATNFQGNVTRENEEMRTAWNIAQGTKLMSKGCTVLDEGTGGAVILRCSVSTRDAGGQAVNGPPVPTVIRMTITPAGISDLTFTYSQPDFNFVGVPFDRWMNANNPDDAARTRFGSWSTIEEAQAFGLLVAQYSEEWAAYLSANGCIFRNRCTLLQARTPRETIEAYVAAYNAQNIEAVMAFFTEESALIGHPFGAEARGISLIRNVQVQDMIAASDSDAFTGVGDAYTISNVEVAGDTVTWDHVWVNNRGQEYCAQGQRAVIKEGTILTWTWPPGDSSCP